ncbi:PKD domain-containing protein [Methanoregula formicica]|uniref:PDK repeat-containing protein n=1 Tax=Methanoregula formicica (strain DSM 22288 / NBRC 105244 / SMSP) TaxID=593750 RepID=L0HEJ7_METFS|nr:PKD domain-containing protein [Methanoregula formicica]AGB02186.1 PDK repeat-containing protein [Methanoregula formicica SMSP]
MRSKTFLLYAGLVVLFLALAIPGASAADTAKAGYITVGIAPVAQFDAHYAFTTIPTKVEFVDTSLGSKPMTWEWDFGDGVTSTEQNPSHTYLRRGTYTVKLTVKNAYGTSTAIKTDYISVGMPPKAAFVGSPTSGGAPMTVAFTDQSTGQVNKWTWDFGDGQGSNEQNPVHTYWAAGNYNVILTVSNEFGISDAMRNEYITVSGDLAAKFDAFPSSGKAPLATRFTDRSTGSPTAWSWDFGDGMTSNQQHPSHTFMTAGSYNVKLTITRGTETASTTQIINVGGVPDADFVGSPLQVNPNENVQFTDKSGHAPTAWSWDFGDTATSTVQNPSHSYQVKGIYTVALTARNENGKDTETKTGYVNVGMPPKADFRPVTTPYAQYAVPKTVQFVDQSTNMPTSWAWDFGDGATSTEQMPTHVYMKEGTYTVTLTVKNNFGSDTAIKQDLITVGGGAAVDFVADKTTVGVGRVVSFTDLSTSNPTNWVWDFGDGTTGTGPNPDHVYRATGVYDVTLTASNPYLTNTRTKNQYITVLSIPRADFVADRTKGGAPMAVAFTDKSSNAPTAWKWDFGDGASSTEQNPTHTYTTLGVYSVTLTASNKDGSDTITKVNYISTTLAPVAEFKANRQVGKAPFIVEFTDLSSNNPTSWSWDFGDGTSSTEQNPRHIYLYEGSYDVSLTVANQYGADSIYKTGTSAPASAVVTTEAPAAAATEQPAAVATAEAPAAAKPTTQAPLSAAVPLLATVIALIGAVFVSRK